MDIVISYRFLGAESENDNRNLSSRFLNIFNFSVVRMHTLTLMQQQKRACSQSLSFSFLAVRQAWLISSKSPFFHDCNILVETLPMFVTCVTRV